MNARSWRLEALLNETADVLQSLSGVGCSHVAVEPQLNYAKIEQINAGFKALPVFRIKWEPGIQAKIVTLLNGRKKVFEKIMRVGDHKK